jgi:hypothetical protein
MSIQHSSFQIPTNWHITTDHVILRRYEESRQAINEGRAVLEEIAGDSADTIMADETAHRKRSAQDDDVEESNK